MYEQILDIMAASIFNRNFIKNKFLIMKLTFTHANISSRLIHLFMVCVQLYDNWTKFLMKSQNNSPFIHCYESHCTSNFQISLEKGTFYHAYEYEKMFIQRNTEKWDSFSTAHDMYLHKLKLSYKEWTITDLDFPIKIHGHDGGISLKDVGWWMWGK